MKFLLAAIIVIALGALGGWYFFLKGESAATRSIDAARGLGVNIPSVQNPTGSTYTNTGGPFTPLGSATSAAQTQAERAGLLLRLANLLTLGRWGAGTFNIGAGITELLPFGGGGGNATTTIPVSLPPQLWRVSPTPSAGIGFVGGTPTLYFAERSTGNILSADPLTGTVTRVTNTLFPKTYEALFARDGGALLRGISETGSITTFTGMASTSAASATSSVATLMGTTFPTGIASIAVHPTLRSVLYIVSDGTSSVGVRASWGDAERKKIFTSRLNNWKIHWLADGRLILAQYAADSVAGHAYEIKNGVFIPVVGDMPGLMILPRTQSSAMLYSTSQGGAVRLFAQVSPTATPVELPIRTIAEKCVWLPGAGLVAYCAVPREIPTRTYVNDRFQGAAPTSDTWWRVDVSAGTVEQLPTPNDQPLDVFSPLVSDGGTHVAFLNARDMSIWVLRISE